MENKCGVGSVGCGFRGLHSCGSVGSLGVHRRSWRGGIDEGRHSAPSASPAAGVPRGGETVRGIQAGHGEALSETQSRPPTVGAQLVMNNMNGDFFISRRSYGYSANANATHPPRTCRSRLRKLKHRPSTQASSSRPQQTDQALRAPEQREGVPFGGGPTHITSQISTHPLCDAVRADVAQALDRPACAELLVGHHVPTVHPRLRKAHRQPPGPSTAGRVSGRRMHVHKAKADVDRAQLVG